jgi:hypothetical protein
MTQSGARVVVAWAAVWCDGFVSMAEMNEA